MKLLGVAVLQPDIQNIKLLGGGGGVWMNRQKDETRDSQINV